MEAERARSGGYRSDHYTDADLHLRIIAIGVLLVTSAFGALLPVAVKQSYSKHSKSIIKTSIAPAFFDFTKYLGSGIIISTAFVHLLSPAFEELKDPSLPAAWLNYDWAPVLAMTAVFAIFTVELLAHRVGTAWLNKIGVAYDAHGHAHSSHGPCEANREHHARAGSVDGIDREHFLDGPDVGESDVHAITEEESLHVPFIPKPQRKTSADSTRAKSPKRPHHHKHQSYGTLSNCNGTANQSGFSSLQGSEIGEIPDHVAAQIIGVAILEFGVLLHSFVIGLTLAVVERFVTLFVVITLHQMFEGLGVGARVANLPLPRKFRWIPMTSGVLYALITPLGLVCGLLVRKTYTPHSPTALIVTGILDSISAGVLLYTGLVELLCAEFLFHQEMREAPLSRVMYALSCVILGAIVMAVLGIWA